MAPQVQLSDETIAECNEVFQLFDGDGAGRVPVAKIGTMLRALGQNPTEAQLQAVIGDVDQTNPKNRVDFHGFLEALTTYRSILASSGNSAYTDDDFIQAFQVFDKQRNGLISVKELRYVLTSLGDALTDAEVDELLKGIAMDKQGNINYEEFVKMLTSNA